MALKLKLLRTENMETPIALLEQNPRFSWQIESDMRSTKQAAYRIEVTKNGNRVWSTGRIESEHSINIRYAGAALTPLTRYEWSVTTWDNYGNTATAHSWWETSREGLPWQAKWAEPVQTPASSNMTEDQKFDLSDQTAAVQRNWDDFQPAQFLRLALTVKNGLKRARLFVSAHGIYRLEINGIRVDDRELAPEITPYDTMLQYQTYDLTDRLDQGENMLAIALADGWWIGRVGLTGDCCQFGDKLGLLLEARLDYEDGSVETITGEKCVSSPGPIVYSDLFVGEKYDARKELTGWSTVAFDDSDWRPVNVAEYSMDNLTPQQGPPVRPIRRFKPLGMITTPEGDTVLDLGQNIAGYVSMTVDAPEGTQIKLEHSEVLNEHGNYINNIIGVNKDQTDIYITKAGRQTYTPWFTYHGFRYVRITGWPGAPTPDNFEAIALSSDVRDIGRFNTSDERLNRLQENIWWSQAANTISIPTDCPQRERAGWTGDIFAYAPTACFNRDEDIFLARWLEQCRHTQMEAGEIPMIVPYLPGYRSIARTMNTHTSCGWGDAILGVPWSLYQAYGDIKVLEDNYEAMKRWVRYAENRVRNYHPLGYKSYPKDKKQRSGYLWNTDFHFGDWLIPSMLMQDDADASVMPVTALLTMFVVGPAYFAYSTAQFAKIAQLLGHTEDAEYYHDLNQKVRKAFIEEYVRDDGTMDADFQGIYVIALQMGLVTEEVRPKMVQHLCDLIEKNGNRLDTGFLSIPFLMDVLCKNGRRDVARRLLYQEDCPSWLYEVKNGATTMWETWQAITPKGEVSNSSYNHYAFGCVGDWMYRELAGLTALEPGYRRIRVRPGLDSCLTHAAASHDTPYGKAAAAWSVHNESVTLIVEIPVGCEAEIILPACAKLDGSPARVENNRYTAGSGRYEFNYPLAEGVALFTDAEAGTPAVSEPCTYAVPRETQKKVGDNTTLEEILANPAAMAVLKMAAPEIGTNPLVARAKTMTIEQLLTFRRIPASQYKILLAVINFAGLFIRKKRLR